jgi:Mrp family chromosome partitioning ATPase
MKELTIDAHASAGGAPASSNHMKLAAAVFGLSLLLFVGFVAMYDMPRVMPAHTAAQRQSAPHGSHLPVPTWQHQMQPAQPQGPPRGPSMNNEHLRALAERIMQSASERAAIVLFTPTSGGLRVENLLGDLGCFLNRNGNRVLVFEARSDLENPSYPVWTGPSSREVAEQLEGYLEGQHERGALCFAETLISGIDYARADLGRHLSGVMSMYRFRRLIADMKERYTIVLMITPERYQGEEDDVFTTLGEGIVVVINEDADPADVETYLRDLRASETPVYGAVTLPRSQGF